MSDEKHKDGYTDPALLPKGDPFPQDIQQAHMLIMSLENEVERLKAACNDWAGTSFQQVKEVERLKAEMVILVNGAKQCAAFVLAHPRQHRKWDREGDVQHRAQVIQQMKGGTTAWLNDMMNGSIDKHKDLIAEVERLTAKLEAANEQLRADDEIIMLSPAAAPVGSLPAVACGTYPPDWQMTGNASAAPSPEQVELREAGMCNAAPREGALIPHEDIEAEFASPSLHALVSEPWCTKCGKIVLDHMNHDECSCGVALQPPLLARDPDALPLHMRWENGWQVKAFTSAFGWREITNYHANMIALGWAVEQGYGIWPNGNGFECRLRGECGSTAPTPIEALVACRHRVLDQEENNDW